MRINTSFLAGIFLGAIAAGATVYFLAHPRSAARPLESIQWRSAEHILPDSFLAAQQAGLLGNLLDLIDEDLQDDPQRRLKPETIDRIAAFCYGARPYLMIEGDSLGQGPFSPERGQLLVALARINLDSVSWQAVKDKASFSAAYLPEADLSHTDLRDADLRNACLRDARLDSANLSNATLQLAILHGANLAHARLHGATLKHADIRWCTLVKADLRGANLDGARLASANLDGARLVDASIQWADATGALLRRADLTHANISGIDLAQAQLDSAVLDSASLVNARLLSTRLPGASLVGADLERVIVLEADWHTLLKQWNVKGIDDLPQRYTLLDGKPKGKTGFRLDKAKQ